jgi:hypothetical protein
MASAVIHLCIAKKIGEKLNNKSELLLLGSIAPDIAKIVGQGKAATHYIDTKDDIPNIKNFLSKYQEYLDNPFELGYFIHLYTDKLWYDNFITNICCNNSIKLKDGTILNTTPAFLTNLIYNDYSNINVDLIDKYELDLSLFYREVSLKKTDIDEFPIDKTNLLLEKMGLIIKNSKSNPTYSLDLEKIEEFIDSSVEIIVDKINEILCK